MTDTAETTISQTLTHSRYPAYKDSGVDWLGEIPAHWELKRAKYACDINLTSLAENTSKAFRFKYVDIGNVTLEEGITQTEEFEFKNAPSRARRIAKSGDTVITGGVMNLKNDMPVKVKVK